MEEKNGSKAGKAIAILFGVMFAGLLVYAVVALSNKERAAAGETETAKEQYYDDHGLSFTYPADYVITNDEEENGLVDILCEVKGSDLSQIEITCTSSEDLVSLSDFEKGVVSRASLNAMKDELRGNILYQNCEFETITRGMLGDLVCYKMDFHVTILSVTAYGVAKIHLNNEGQMLLTVMVYENEEYKNALESIEQSIELQ